MTMTFMPATAIGSVAALPVVATVVNRFCMAPIAVPPPWVCVAEAVRLSAKLKVWKLPA